jgi:hypothetical protein
MLLCYTKRRMCFVRILTTGTLSDQSDEDGSISPNSPYPSTYYASGPDPPIGRIISVNLTMLVPLAIAAMSHADHARNRSQHSLAKCLLVHIYPSCYSTSASTVTALS